MKSEELWYFQKVFLYFEGKHFWPNPTQICKQIHSFQSRFLEINSCHT